MLSVKSTIKASIAATFIYILSACGGGGGDAQGSDRVGASDLNSAGDTSIAQSQSVNNLAMADDKPKTRQEAARFLTQATFGPTESDIYHLMGVGYSTWFAEQAKAATAASYKNYWDWRTAGIRSIKPGSTSGAPELNHPFWKNAIIGPDQLRQRIAFALSEIFVVSVQDGCGANNSKSAADYLDMLGKKAFGTYRDLLESVALHPIMGCYLSHMRNQKEDVTTGRVPDENFAREIMQLMSIGLHQLNLDGTAKLSLSGQPIDTYGAGDITGLAKVFTGWSLACPDSSDRCFRYTSTQLDTVTPDRWWMPMQPYANFHSSSEKRFLGLVIPAQSVASPATSLKIALDGIAAHPNVAPFISKQLIQRFVTSNPSPAYVQRVSTVFKTTNGNIQATVKAILLDTEARNMANTSSDSFGKVREPILRLSALLRAYGAQSKTNNFILWSTADAGTGLAQSPLQSPSVFNFFRPGYLPPGSESAKANLVAPEMQILHETSAAGYVNYMRNVIDRGAGGAGYDGTDSLPDVRLEYQSNPNSSMLTLAATPEALVENINQRLMYGTMPASLKLEIISAISTIDYRDKLQPKADQIAATYNQRLRSALLLAVASPEFQVQQ